MSGLSAAFAVLAAIQDDASAKLGEATKKAADWKSYKYISEDAGGKGARGPTEGVYEKDKGLVVKAGKLEYIVTDAKTVYKGTDGAWSDQNPAGGKGGGGKKKGGSTAPKYPHLALADFEKKFSKVTSAAEGDGVVYSGDLTSEGANSLSGRTGGTLEAKGTAKVTVNKEGQIVKVEINIAISGKVKDKDVNFSVNRKTTYSDLNTAKAEISEDAKKALGL